MKLSKREYLILSCLSESEYGPITDKVIALSIKDMNLISLTKCSESSISRSLKILKEEELIKEGAKDGRDKTYYLTQKGVELAKSLEKDDDETDNLEKDN